MKKFLCLLLAFCTVFCFSACEKPQQSAQYVVEKNEITANKPSVERMIFVGNSVYYYHNNDTYSDGGSYIAENDIYVPASNLNGKMGITLDSDNKTLTYNGLKTQAENDGFVNLKDLSAAFGFSYIYDDVQKTASISKRYCENNNFDTALLNAAKDTVLKKTKLMDEHCGYNFPEGSLYGVYEPNEYPGWVGGFYSGLNYLCTDWSDDPIYSDTAVHTQEKLEKMIYDNPQVFTHDIGFTIYLSSYKEYMKTKSEESAKTVVYAADALMARIKENGNYIQAWGALDGTAKENNTRMIADTMCNLPLLFAASEITGDAKYKEAAVTHAKLNQKFIIRKNATITHTFIFNEDGSGGTEKTHQGAADNSCWSRGMAWVIHGMSMAYDATGDTSFLDSAKQLIDTYILRGEDDLIPRWDYIYQNNETEPMDTSAAAIAACGMMNIYQSTNDEFYKNTAYYIFESLYKNYSSKNDENSSGILYHATGNLPSGKNIDVCLIYGDYYFAELLARFGGENVGY